MTTLDMFLNPKDAEKTSQIEEVVEETVPKEPAEEELKRAEAAKQARIKRQEFLEAMKPWTKKYAPKDSTELMGNQIAVQRVKKFISNYGGEKKKCLLLWGPSGVGKSSIVNAISEELNLEFIELNASDKRNKAAIEEQLSNVLKQQSLFGNSKVILIDDIDGTSGHKDRGGAAAIIKQAKDSKFPIVITCQDPYVDKVKPVRSKSTLVEFKALTEVETIQQLAKVLTLEEIEYTKQDLEIIAKNSRGDLRAAVNDAQMLTIGKKKLDLTILDSLAERLKNKDMKTAITQILKGTSAKETLNAFDNVSGDVFNQGLLWLDENMPQEYTSKVDRARAYGCLTKANVFQARIMRRQHWRFLVYVNTLLTAGVATAKSQAYTSNIQYKESGRIFKLWQAKMKYGKRKTIAEKIASKVHSSSKDIIKNFEFYQIMLSKSKEIQNELELDSDEVAYLNKISA